MQLYSGDIIRVRNYPFQDDPSRGKSRYAMFLSKIGEEVSLAPATQIGTLSGRAGSLPLRPFEVEIPAGVTSQTGIKGVVKCDRFPLIDQQQLQGTVIGRLPIETRIEIIQKYEQIHQNRRFKEPMDQENPNHPQIMMQFKDLVIAEKLGFLKNQGKEYEEVRDLDCQVTGVYLHPSKLGIPVHHVSLTFESYDPKINHHINHKATIATSDEKEVLLRKLQEVQTTQDVLHLDSRYTRLQRELTLAFSNLNSLHLDLHPQSDFQTVTQLAQEVLNHRLTEHKIWLGSNGRQGKQLMLNGLDLSGCEVTSSHLNQAVFYRCIFKEMDLSQKDFTDTEFDSCHFRVTNLHRANLTNVTFQDCELTRTNLSRTLMDDTRFLDTDLSPKYISNREMPSIYLHEARVKGVEFENTKFSQELFEHITKEPIGQVTVKEKNFKGMAIQKEGDKWGLLSNRGKSIENASFHNYKEAKQGVLSFLQYEKSLSKGKSIDL
ncbi:pentapeptide repeat-containing protein [Fictibacillus terranigra]|uniref:Pentapeptide repeat-containing protein n=1 Tax=Fictibacillus terranigra TaxID=3058424 RepID=A0ABT8EC23_9BACL|nr:pentapeptide repeat-containing protein [Fictibacillus sp. CENA-BCM004]MDN4075488.1 pentapeptide repeat-containing protein [Fictibacillus sp. CENA-BCM004]